MSVPRRTRLFRNTGLWLMVLGLNLYGLFDQGVFGCFVMGKLTHPIVFRRLRNPR